MEVLQHQGIVGELIQAYDGEGIHERLSFP
jgi:hypothetical protein